MAVIVLPPAPATNRLLGIPIKEAEVHDAVSALRAALLPTPTATSDLVIAHELALAYGRPDVVVAEARVDIWRAWRRRGIRPCTAPLVLTTALALHSVGGLATTEVLVPTETDRTSRARIRRSLATLVELGWVKRHGDSFELRLAPGDSIARVAGVEAKLNNWRRAVGQVQSWEGYADAVWLAFPSGYLPHVPRTTTLRRFGLIAVQDGRGTIVRKPVIRRGSGVRRILIEQHLFARWLTTSRGPRNSPILPT